MKVLVLEHAVRKHAEEVIPSSKSVAIVCSKVSSVLSGGRLSTPSLGGEIDYCSVFMDSGQEILVCGAAHNVQEWLELKQE